MNNTYTVVQQAKLLFFEKGYDAVSEQDIMQICGLKEKEFTNQFKDKDHLFSLILDTMCQDIDHLIFTNYVDPYLIPEQKIINYMQSYMQYVDMVYTHLHQSHVGKENVLDHPTVHHAYQRLEYSLSSVLLEMMNTVLYELDDINLLQWNKDHLNQQIQQSNHVLLFQALDIQQSLYNSKISVHTDQLTLEMKRVKWREIMQIEQAIMNSQDRCLLVKTLLHCIEQHPIVMLDSFAGTEQRSYEMH